MFSIRSQTTLRRKYRDIIVSNDKIINYTSVFLGIHRTLGGGGGGGGGSLGSSLTEDTKLTCLAGETLDLLT